MVRLGTVTAAVLVLACSAGAPPPSPLPPAPEVAIADLELRALLLLLADRRTWEPFTIEQALAADSDLRAEVAVALGRVGDPRGVAVLEELSVAASPGVRRAAVFALGRIDVPASRSALLRALTDEDRETGRLAAAALAGLEVPFDQVLRAAALPPTERRARLLPALWRYSDPEARALAERALEDGEAEPRRWAAYALARNPQPESAPALRGLLADADPWVRGWAARALGRIGEGGDLARLRPLLDDPEPGPVIRALGAAARLLAAGAAAPPGDWRRPLVALFEAGHRGVRLAALEASSWWLLDEALAERLVAAAGAAAPAERRAALLALATGGDDRAPRLVYAAAAAEDAGERAAAAAAAAVLGERELTLRLLADGEPRVRQAALTGLLAAADEPGPEAAAALADPDPGVRAAALGWFADRPVEPVASLLPALGGAAFIDRLPELPLNGIRAVVARAQAAPGELETAAFELERLARADSYLLRRAAAEGLEQLGRPRPPIGWVDTGRRVLDYRQILQRTWRPREVELVTRHGTVRLRLACREAPLTCLNFLQLVGQGFYDGLTFHRVVPDFVVQGGDPRGDGWGGPGYTLRDEVNRLGFAAGTIGMALGGPDTGGSQFFITLSDQPHLDRDFTAFGRVVGGWDALQQIGPGDVILEAREVGLATPSRPPGLGPARAPSRA